MRTICLSLSEQQHNRAAQKAASLGVTTTAYIRGVLKDSFNRRDIDRQHQETLRAIRALIPILAEACCRTQRIPRDLIDRLTKTLLDRYAQDLTDKEA